MNRYLISTKGNNTLLKMHLALPCQIIHMTHLNLKYSLWDWQDTIQIWGWGNTKTSQIVFSAWEFLLLGMHYLFPMEIRICGLSLITAEMW